MTFTPPTTGDTVSLDSLPVANQGTIALTRGRLLTSVGGSGTGTYNLASGTTFEQNGGALALTGTQFTGAGTLVLTGGDVTGSPATFGKLTLKSVNLNSSFTIPSTSTVTIPDSAVPRLYNGAVLTNNGAVTSDNGYIALHDGTVTNNGTWLIKNYNATPFYNWTGLATNAVTNAAGAAMTFTPPTSGDTVSLDSLPVANQGTIALTRGRLLTSVGGSGTGTYNLATGTTFEQNGGALALGGSQFTGAGTLVLAGGDVTGSPATLGKLTLKNVNLNSSFTIPSTSTVTIPDSAVPRLYNGAVLTNNGSLTSDNAYIALHDGTITNNGTWLIKNYNATPFYNWTGLATNAVTNAAGATMTFTPPTSGDTVSLDSLPVANQGTIALTTGRLFTSVGGSGSGTYNLATGTTLEQNGGVLDLQGASFPGAGTLRLSGGDAFGAPSSLGTVTLGDLSMSTGNLTLPTGSTTTIPANSGPRLFNGRRLINNGALTSNDGFVYFYDGKVVNNGTLTVKNFNNDPFYNMTGATTNTVQNATAGRLDLDLPATGSTLALSMPLTNDGTLRALRGTTTVDVTNLVGTTLQSGTLVADGGTLQLNKSIATNNGTVTIVTGGMKNATADSLAALRTNNGTITLSRSITGTGPVTNTGSVWLKAGTFRPTTYTQSGGSTRIDSGAVLRGGSAGTGAVAINGGALTGGGTVEGPLTNAGTVQPGATGTPLAVTGTYTQPSTGTMGVTISGITTVGTDYSKLTSSGVANLAGTLTIGTSPGVNPPVGTSLRILDAGSRSGTFGTVTGIDTLPAGKYWSVQYDATGVSLVVKADPAATVGSASVTEGNSGTTSLVIPVTLDRASERTVTYDYTTVAQTASAPDDYTAASGTLTFAPGQTTKNVTVTVNGDTTFEPDETFLVRLSNPVNGGVAANDGVGTITNDDPEPPRLTVTAISPSSVGQDAGRHPDDLDRLRIRPHVRSLLQQVGTHHRRGVGHDRGRHTPSASP